MKKIKALPATKLQKPNLYQFALLYAFIVVLVTTYLLFKFDELTEAIHAHNIAGGSGGVTVAVLTVTAGVLALPYLLRMSVSPLMRIVSSVCTFIAPMGWLMAAWWLELHAGRADALLPMLVAHVSVLLAIIAVWVIGLPVKPLKKRP